MPRKEDFGLSPITWPLIDALTWIPQVVAYRVHQGRVNVPGGTMKLGEEGMPEIGASVGGKAVFFVTGSHVGTLSLSQRTVHQRLREAGADVWVVRSVAEALQIMADKYGASANCAPRPK